MSALRLSARRAFLSSPIARHSRFLHTSTQSLPISILAPVAIFSNVSGFLTTIWESILRAVPKKKSSYARKRTRQLTGKALKDVENLNHCSSCGRVKRSHTLCPYCVASIKDLWRNKGSSPTETENAG